MHYLLYVFDKDFGKLTILYHIDYLVDLLTLD